MPSLNDIFHGPKATPRANVQNAVPEKPARRSRDSVKKKAPTQKEKTPDE